MLKKIVLMLTLALSPMMATASDQGTAEEASAMVDRAIALYASDGLEAMLSAVGDKSNPDFHDRDLYVFVSEIDGVMLAHGANPALVGRDLSGLVDANGSQFVAEMMSVARTAGDGWVDYVWANPATGKMESKSSRVVRFGDKYYAAVGIYKG